MLQALDPVVPNHKPQLQCTEAPTKRDLPVTIVDDGTRFGCLVAEILRKHTERLNQVIAVRDVETIAIKIREHPLVRVEAVAVGIFDAGVDRPELRTERSCA